MNNSKKSITTHMMAFVLTLAVAANVIMGIVLMRQSTKAMKTLIEQRMLDLSNTAAAMLNGDSIRDLSAEDKGTPEYENAMQTLRYFQENVELDYIYGVRREPDGHFIFTFDPTVGDPASFGDTVVSTPALVKAGSGTASVDEEPYEDEWGRFYSAYSPVFGSDGKVAGIVAADFDAEWYDSQITKHLMTIIVFTAATTVICILLVITLTSGIRKRFEKLSDEMDSLDSSVKSLNELIKFESDEKVGNISESEKKFLVETLASGESSQEVRRDEIAALSEQMKAMHWRLERYINYVHEQAFKDAMTGVGNKTAYMAKVRRLDKMIEEGSARFAVAVFDINALKVVNDNFGHEYGDALIVAAADSIKAAFDINDIYRIGGDEFIAVVEGAALDDMTARFAEMDRFTKEYNSDRTHKIMLAVSKGADEFVPGSSEDYRCVFKKADEAMYRDKDKFYERMSQIPD